MEKSPRKLTSSFFTLPELTLSLIQGSIITIACLGLGYYYMDTLHDEATIRTVIYTTLIFSNIFLTLVNRSFHQSMFTTIRYKNNLILIIILASLAIFFMSIYFPPVRNLFLFVKLTSRDLVLCISFAFVGVMWVEIFKWVRRTKKK